ncbi:unnamed protein product [Sympodiomycopsis kandeliae]
MSASNTLALPPLPSFCLGDGQLIPGILKICRHYLVSDPTLVPTCHKGKVSTLNFKQRQQKKIHAALSNTSWRYRLKKTNSEKHEQPKAKVRESSNKWYARKQAEKKAGGGGGH